MEVTNFMIPLTITTDLEKTPWTDLKPHAIRRGLGTITHVGRLPRGTDSGKSTVTVRITMPDGLEVIAETTLALFANAALAMQTYEEHHG